MEAPVSVRPQAVLRHRGMVARTVLVSGLTLVSRLLGFAREALMAAVFGERSVVSDAFITAWRFPNLFRRLLGEGALSTALQTEMTKADIERGDAAGRALFRATLRWMSGILALVTVLGMLLMYVLPDTMPVTGWTWLGPHPAIVRDLTVRVLPYVLLVCGAAICGGALAVRGHFTLPNLAPTAMNVIWIGTLVAIGVASDWGRAGSTSAEGIASQWSLARGLAWGLLAGGLVQLVLHFPPLRRFGLVGPSAGERADPLPVLRTTAPLVIGAAIYQINVMIDGLMAESLLTPGGPSALYYANRVQQFPMALISTAAITAVFPLLNAHGHLGERVRVREIHDRTQLGILFLGLPAAMGLFALALPISSVCYEHGNYGLEGTQRVASALRCIAFALVPAGAAALASRVFVAMGDMKTPVRLALVSLVINVVLNAISVVVFHLDVAGMSIATALTTAINLAWLLRSLRTRLELPPGAAALRGRVLKITLASLLAALAAWGAHRATAAGLGVPEARRSILALFAGLGASGLIYALAARALRIPEWNEITARVRARLVRRT